MLSLKRVELSLDEVEHFLVALAAKVAPWAADLPVAYLAARNIIDVLQWHPAIGWVAACAVEALGLACTATALEFADYNATRRKTDPPAPASMAWAMVGVYFGASLVLSLLATFTGLELFAILVWPVISSVGTMVHAMRQDHTRRLAANEQVKAQAREERARKREERRAERSQAVQNTVQNSRELSEQEQTLVQYIAEHPGHSYRTISAVIGHSPSWISTTVQRLEREGIMHRNGNGLEIVA